MKTDDPKEVEKFCVVEKPKLLRDFQYDLHVPVAKKGEHKMLSERVDLLFRPERVFSPNPKVRVVAGFIGPRAMFGETFGPGGGKALKSTSEDHFAAALPNWRACQIGQSFSLHVEFLEDCEDFHLTVFGTGAV